LRKDPPLSRDDAPIRVSHHVFLRLAAARLASAFLRGYAVNCGRRETCPGQTAPRQEAFRRAHRSPGPSDEAPDPSRAMSRPAFRPGTESEGGRISPIQDPGPPCPRDRMDLPCPPAGGQRTVTGTGFRNTDLNAPASGTPDFPVPLTSATHDRMSLRTHGPGPTLLPYGPSDSWTNGPMALLAHAPGPGLRTHDPTDSWTFGPITLRIHGHSDP
jgi:hypothetical protein